MKLSTVARTLKRRLSRPLHRPELRAEYDVLGSHYGGWPLLRSTPQGAVIYSFGVGTDISFDLTAIERFGCTVVAFDPTPRSLEWLEGLSPPAGFRHLPVGIGGADMAVEFFAPDKAEHVSFSIRPNDARSRDVVMARVMRLESIMAEFGLPNPDVIKMDIEGFEYEVIDDFSVGSVRPQQVLVEFHHGLYGIADGSTITAVRTLNSIGYRLFYVSPGGHEYGFALL